MRKVDKIIITLLLITAFEHERSQVEKQFFATDAIEPCQCWKDQNNTRERIPKNLEFLSILTK